MNRQGIQSKLNLANRENFRLNYLKPALEQGLIEITISNKPNSSLQKYRLTIVGEQLKSDFDKIVKMIEKQNLMPSQQYIKNYGTVYLLINPAMPGLVKN